MPLVLHDLIKALVAPLTRPVLAGGLVVNHYLWICYFRDAYEYRVPQIMAFFVPCVWLVPFLYFVSVSLGDNVLPSATHSGGLGSGSMGGGMSEGGACPSASSAP